VCLSINTNSNNKQHTTCMGKRIAPIVNQE
jgi:hypothetical protein